MSQNQIEMSLPRNMARRSTLVRVAAVAGILTAGVFFHAATTPAAAESVGTVTFRNYTISVVDLDRSIKFYTEVFGFTIDRPRVKVGQVIAKLVEQENVDAEFQWLLKDGARLQLIQYKTPATVPTPRRVAVNQQGFIQHAFEVSDIDAVLGAVKKFGGAVVEASRITDKQGKTRLVFATDPDGARVEIISVAKPAQ